jgi:uncharacterized protein
LQLEISSLKDNKGKSLDFKFEKSLPSLDLGGRVIAFNKPVIVEGTATNVESGILVNCTIKAGISVNCDRCLQPVDVKIETTATEEFVEARNAGFHGNDHGNEPEKEFSTYKGTIIDISQVVEQNIILNIPMKTLCCADCKGICAFCGTDLNLKECNCLEQDVDPRMEKLKDWFKE